MEKAFDLRDENLEAKKLVDEHFEFLNSGNTGSVSDGSEEVLGLHDVRRWNDSRHSITKDGEPSVESTLGNRTDSGNECVKDISTNSKFEYMCDKCECFLNGEHSCKNHSGT